MTKITRNIIKANGINLHYREAGQGPAMILLHGWPQTSYSWRKVISPLSERYRVIAPDLRGMGDSDKPVGGYDMRTVATDIRELMTALDIKNPYLVGADWGGLVARRFALDWPGELARVAIVDIVPHGQMFANFKVENAQAAWHFFFNAVPDLPEQLVSKDVRGFLQGFFRPKYHYPANLDEAIDEYTRAYSKPGALRGGFAYYKAMFEENRRLDEESLGKTIQDPMHCVWGNSGGMGSGFDVLEMWRPDAPNITGRGIENCGHYVHEEAPDILIEELIKFGAD